jgi:enoyl-CoA hydratase/carnithine racemase
MIDRIVHGEIHELRLNRPPVNALSPELLGAIAAEVREAPENGAAAVVISGRDGLFSAGLDLPALLALDGPALGHALEAFFDAMEALASSAIPVSAAITGHSPAGGAILALFCDWRVMARGDFAIGLNEVRIGIAMPEVVAALAARTVGPRTAETLCVSGRLVSPEQALEIGLVDALAAPERVVDEALSWCGLVLESPAAALAATRSTVRRDLVELVQSRRQRDIELLAERWFEPEVQATLHAVVAKLKGR